MRSCVDVPGSGHFDRPSGAFEVVPPVYPFQGFVVTGLDTIFKNYDIVFRKGSEPVKFLLVDAIRSGADNESYDRRMRKCLLVFEFQFIERTVRVRVGLEISQVMFDSGVAPAMEFYSFINLLQEGFPWSAVAGMESGIVAIGAPPGTDCPVPVGAGEPGVQHQLLKPLAIFEAVASG